MARVCIIRLYQTTSSNVFDDKKVKFMVGERECMRCKHFLGFYPQKDCAPYCKAFPKIRGTGKQNPRYEAIPGDVYIEKISYDKHIEGNHGYLFEGRD